MAAIHYEKDVDRAVLENRTVAVVGYGSRGRAHALNLRDSGVRVVVADLPGSAGARRAAEDGFSAVSAAEAAAGAGAVMVLVPDRLAAKVCESDILPNLAENGALLFAHGFAVHYGQVVPPDNIDVVLVSPMGPAAAVRSEFEAGSGVPCLVAVHRDFSGRALRLALAYGAAIGGARAGLVESGFAEETEASLFAGQAVIAGGLSELVRCGYDALVEAGCQPEAAYLATAHQLRLAADLVRRGGPGLLGESLPGTAEYGALTRGPRVAGEASREAMREIMGEIQNGSFAREWLCESMVGGPVLARLRERGRGHPMEAVGARLRKMTPPANSGGE